MLGNDYHSLTLVSAFGSLVKLGAASDEARSYVNYGDVNEETCLVVERLVGDEISGAWNNGEGTERVSAGLN